MSKVAIAIAFVLTFAVPGIAWADALVCKKGPMSVMQVDYIAQDVRVCGTPNQCATATVKRSSSGSWTAETPSGTVWLCSMLMTEW